jgi:uncharacterized membrane protein YqhA
MVRYSSQNLWKLYNCLFSYNVDGLLVHLLPSTVQYMASGVFFMIILHMHAIFMVICMNYEKKKIN